MPGLLILIFCVVGYAAFCPDDPRLPQILKVAALSGGTLVALRLVWGWVAEQVHLARHVERLGKLDAFAARLGQGTTDGRGFYSGGITTVAGQLDGRALELLIRLGPRSSTAFELPVPPGLELDAHRPQLPARLAGAGPIVALARGAPRAELESVIRQLLMQRGIGRLTAGGGRLRAEKTFSGADLSLDWLVDTARALTRIARLAQAQQTPSSAPSEASGLRCPFCHGALDLREDVTDCGTCQTTHHRECFTEAGGCTVFGCAGAGHALKRRGRARAKVSQGPHNFLGERSPARP